MGYNDEDFTFWVSLLTHRTIRIVGFARFGDSILARTNFALIDSHDQWLREASLSTVGSYRWERVSLYEYLVG